MTALSPEKRGRHAGAAEKRYNNFIRDLENPAQKGNRFQARKAYVARRAQTQNIPLPTIPPIPTRSDTLEGLKRRWEDYTLNNKRAKNGSSQSL